MNGFRKGLSRVRGNLHARFLGGWRLVTVAAYPILCGLKRHHGEMICYTVQEFRIVTAMCNPNNWRPTGSWPFMVLRLLHTLQRNFLPTCGKQGQRVRWAADPTC